MARARNASQRASQWAAVRALREAELPVTVELLAQAAGGVLNPDELSIALEAAGEGEAHPLLLTTQLAAMRQLLRGEPPTILRVSSVAEIDPSMVTTRGLKEGWKKPHIPHWRKRVRAELEMDAGVGIAAQVPLDIEKAAPEASPDTNAPDVPEMGRAARVSDMLVKHADKLLTQMEVQGGLLSKPQLDAMLAMVRLAEKFEPLAVKETAELQKKSDAEVAEVYAYVERRIDERARAYATRMVAEREAAERGGDGGVELDAAGQ